MKKIIDDWLIYFDNPKKIDKSHFFTLFSEGLSDSEIKVVLEKFPNSDLLFENLENVKSIATNKDILNSSKEELIELVKKDIKEKIKACQLIGENQFVEQLKKLKYYFIEDNNEFDSMVLDNENYIFSNFISNVSFFVDSKRKYKYEAFYGLEEAIYCYTNDYQLTWHIMSPLISDDINFNYYYDFINRGGDYVIYKEGIYVIKCIR
ncbi:hypothetical protein [Flavivirga rizhaonensis]|uniref:Uncharacterized protein n=1 Tax=Flavivirga rizhaonensis TaxID=2559571 RepID=A0A4S1DUJ6_9FLAO|nr:hypothetical protein [Flavivirga rizhaonensis]TGV01082.1 hypothetical protein EM932_17130 [Flavivirga rizhaonensis]